MSSQVEECWQRAKAAWPFALDRETFDRHVSATLAEVPAIYAEDVYLALACVAGDPTALAALEREHLAGATAALQRAGYNGALVDEAIQLLRYRLLVATPEREAKLATYRGVGALAGWLRVTALRQARALLGPRTPTLDTAREPGGDARLEATLLARDHGPQVKALLRDAIGKLEEKPREALRLEVVEGMPHHAIAALWGVHRTTVVRWIEEARQAIASSVRRSLRVDLGLGVDSVESLLRSLDGYELSIASALKKA